MSTLAMSGYGAYVWASFGLAAIVFIYNEWAARRSYRAVYRDLEVRVRAMEDTQ